MAQTVNEGDRPIRSQTEETQNFWDEGCGERMVRQDRAETVIG
jgi:hypothetical protein